MPSTKYLALERALLAAVTLTAVSLAAQLPLAVAGVASTAVVVLLGLHHWRPQLVFVYVAVVALAVVAVCDANAWHLARAVALGVALVTLVLGIAGALVFPLPVNFSRLRGDYQTIGCRTMRLGGVDCRVFYPVARGPSDVDATRRVPYLHHGKHLAAGMSAYSKAPQWFFNPLESAFLAAIADATPVAAPPQPSGWPLVVFSHGLGGSLEIYATIVQELASRGYVVVIVNHCDGSASATRHADGRYALAEPVPQPHDNEDAAATTVRFRERQLTQRVAEVRSVLDAAEALATTLDVFRAVDFGAAHVAGHSFGAATALSAAYADTRFCSAVLHDAWMLPASDAAKRGLGDRVPVLHIVSEHFQKELHDNMAAIEAHVRGCTHARTELLVLRGSHHNNFTDLPQFSPLVTRVMGASGVIEPYYAERAIAEASAAFVSGTRTQREVATQFPELVPVKSR